MSTHRQLAAQFDIAIQEYCTVLTKVRNPDLTSDERLEMLQACDALWDRVVAARHALEGSSIEHADL